jgi:hypothetical protein
MTIYPFIQAILVTVVVLSSAIYTFSYLLPDTSQRVQQGLYSAVGGKKPAMVTISRKTGCGIACANCTGCGLKALKTRQKSGHITLKQSENAHLTSSTL